MEGLLGSGTATFTHFTDLPLYPKETKTLLTSFVVLVVLISPDVPLELVNFTSPGEIPKSQMLETSFSYVAQLIPLTVLSCMYERTA